MQLCNFYDNFLLILQEVEKEKFSKKFADFTHVDNII